MIEKPSVFDMPRFTIFIDSKLYDHHMIANGVWEDFKEIDVVECSYDEDYVIALVEALDPTVHYTVEDVIDITGALAVHEEWTNAFVVEQNDIDKLSTTYPWNEGGMTFFGDMLTYYEKLFFLLTFLKEEEKEAILSKEIYYNTSKDDKDYKPLDNCPYMLFGDIIYNIKYKDKTEILYWPSIIEDKGFFLVVIDPDLNNKDDDDDEYTKLLPLSSNNKFGPTIWDDDDEYYWGEYGYGDYDFRRY